MKPIIFASILILVLCVLGFAQNEQSCLALSVSGGGQVERGEPMTFTASVRGSTTADIIYHWTVSAGTISNGQGTPSIRIDTTNWPFGTKVKATVKVKGVPEN